jgi:hypothetical protein
MYNINTCYRVKCCSKTLFEKSDFLVQLDHFSPVGFGRIVFWSSCRLVELPFGRVGLTDLSVVELSVVELTDYPWVDVVDERVCR